MKCGGFIFGYRFNHTISDGVGTLQFMYAIGDLARGSESPSISPIWERHLITASNPPHVPCAHPEYDSEHLPLPPPENMVERSFFFTPSDIAALRRSLPPPYRSCSRFDILSACVWRCRAVALSENPNDKFRMLYIVSVRSMLEPPLLTGYYGNAIVAAHAAATAEELSKNPLHRTVELVTRAKAKVTVEHVKSVVNLLVIRDRPVYRTDRIFMVSDLGRLAMDELDFGWGKAAYAGMAKAGPYGVPGLGTWFIPFKNGTIVPLCLPPLAMDKFRKELEAVVEDARRRAISDASAL